MRSVLETKKDYTATVSTKINIGSLGIDQTQHRHTHTIHIHTHIHTLGTHPLGIGIHCKNNTVSPQHLSKHTSLFYEYAP